MYDAMSPPRILISYFFGSDMIPLGASCARSFASLGFEVECFNSQVENQVEVWILRRLNRLLKALGLKSMAIGENSRFGKVNHKKIMLREAVRRFRPQWVLVVRAHHFVDRPFVEELKSRYGIEKVIGWRVDGPRDCPDLIEDAAIYDRYFCIHRHGYDPQRDRIHFLPVFGVDPELYPPPPQDRSRRYSHDIVFVGGSNPRRQAIVSQLLDLPIELYGGWLLKRNRFNLALRRRVKGKGIWGPELVELYHSSRIVLNISAWDPAEFSGLNLRVFDVPATGAFLLTDYSPELEDYYTIGKDIECFRSVAELRAKLRYYLEHPAEREAIAHSGYQKSLTLPTVTERVKAMIEAVTRETGEAPSLACRMPR